MQLTREETLKQLYEAMYPIIEMAFAGQLTHTEMESLCRHGAEGVANAMAIADLLWYALNATNGDNKET